MEDRFEKGMSVLKITNKDNINNIFKRFEDIAPDLARFIVEFPYSEIYTREAVDLKTRELCTIASLTTLGAIPELKSHIEGALNVDCTPTEIVEIIMQMSAYIGFPRTIEAMFAAKEIFEEKDLLPLTE